MNKTKRKAAKRSLRRLAKRIQQKQLQQEQQEHQDHWRLKPENAQISRVQKARPGYFLNEYGFEQPLPKQCEIIF